MKTFEVLKVEAAKRNVALSVVDLRWGVTQEEAKTGKVISVCLDEIEKSHPFFIGILGNNYGTAPDRSVLQKNPELLERHPWLDEAISDDQEKSMSITEMEIQYGVLLNDAEIDAAFFFRNSDQPDNDKRLTKLKGKIRKRHTTHEYDSLSELCKKVSHEVREIIKKHFPQKGPATPLDRERSAQRAYINSRHSCFFPRPLYSRIIDTFACSNKQHLVLTGESGVGKSALLANWIKKNEDNPNFNLAYHFVGNSFSGNGYENILRHLCDEIYDLYAVDKKEGQDEDIVQEAHRLVSEVCFQEKPLVVVLDGIDQIIAPKGEKLQLWLPPANKKVKYIFSTLPDDDTMATFKRRKYKTKRVLPMTKEERTAWIPRYLMRVGKKLDGEKRQLERIVNDTECENTLVMRTLLDELTCFGIYEKVDERIDYYLSAASIPEFFDRVLQRMEDDYSAGRDLVRHALTLLAVSEHGLTEDELTVLIGCDKRPLEWKLFFCAFYNNFVVRNGLISFSHKYVEEAVVSRYHVDDIQTTEPYRREIIGYFSSRKKENRSNTELAFQNYNVSDWDNLFRVLADFDTFNLYYNHNQYLLGLYWKKLVEADKEKYSPSAYLHLPSAQNKELAMTLNSVGLFTLEVMADFTLALEYFASALEIGNKVFGKRHHEISTFYHNIGIVHDHLEEYGSALEYYEKALEILKRHFGAQHPETVTTYNNIGEVHRVTADFKKAETYHEKALKICEKHYGAGHPATAVSYNNLGLVYYDMGYYEKALELHLKSLSINENILGENHPETAKSSFNAGMDLEAKGKISRAVKYYMKDLSVNMAILGEDHPDTADSYNNIGELYRKEGLYGTAKKYHQKALEIRQKVFGKRNHHVAQSHHNLGLVYLGKKDLPNAKRHLAEALNIWLDVFGEDNQHVAICYNSIGMWHDRQKQINLALENYRKALEIQERIYKDDNPDMVMTHINIGSTLHEMGKEEEALDELKKAYDTAKALLGDNHEYTMAALDWIYTLTGNS